MYGALVHQILEHSIEVSLSNVLMGVFNEKPRIFLENNLYLVGLLKKESIQFGPLQIALVCGSNHVTKSGSFLLADGP